jgi:hypothetical protein
MSENELSEQAQAAAQLWQKALSFAELCELSAQFIEGKIKFCPTYCAENVDEETAPLADYLAALNRAGLLTDCSQPGMDQGHSKQRAFVTGLASEEVAARIERLSLTTDLYICVSRPGESNGCRMPVTIDVFRPYSWAGEAAIDEENGSFAELHSYERICSGDALRELNQACYVTIIDLSWGRTDYLWNELAKELCFLMEPHDE